MSEQTLRGWNKIKVYIQSSRVSCPVAEYHSALEYHSAFDGTNHVFAERRNGMKHAEHDVLRRQGAVVTFQEVILDPIDRSPFGHLMKFTQRSFPLYYLGLGTTFYRLGLSAAFTDKG